MSNLYETMRKIRVMLIYPTDPLGPKVGGAETFIKGFIKYAPEDFEIEMVGISSDMTNRPTGKWINLKMGDKDYRFLPIFFEKNENKKTLIPLSLRFTIALKFFNIQIDGKILFFNRIEPAILFKDTRNPKIVVIHSDIPVQILNRKSESLWRYFTNIYLILSRSIFKALRHVYVVSENTLKYYFEKYADERDKFSFLPTWVDAEIFNVTSESKESIRKVVAAMLGINKVEDPWILFVGRLQKVKAPFRLMDTFIEFRKRYNKGSLVVVGEGDLKKRLIEYVNSSGLDKNVFFVGHIGQDILASIYRASDALLLTSESEGMPRCVLEALGCGIPVVTTDVGAVAKIVKNGISGEIAWCNSEEELVRRLIRVLDHPLVYTKEKCVDSIADYTPQKVLGQVYDYLRSL